ncbi:MAG: hypothetical protein A2Z95_07740 [Gallionellales bacterium GWA2_60_18]|nr:MAG: hypothetical protein A2Z95_07740 [Gallionellales bacterium GWA2_60_18]
MTWHDLNLGEAVRVKHGYAFKGEFFAKQGALMVVTPGNFVESGGFRVRPGKERYYTADFPDDYLLSEDDLVVAMTEQGEGLLGSAARVPESGKYLHNQRIGLVIVTNTNTLNKQFAYWLFNSRPVREQLRGSSTGTKVRHTAPERIYKVRVRIPPVEVQSRVAATLDAYDKLIETNRRRIALLEESAKLLYQEWFVSLRFPGYETATFSDGLPKGWAKMPLGDLAFIVMGQSPESKFYNQDGEGLPFHQGVSDFSDHFVNHKTYTTQATRIADVGDILCSVRAPVGRLNLTRDKIAIGRGVSAIRSHAGQQSLLLYQLKALFVEEDMIGGGTIFASVTKKELFAQQLLQPDSKTATEFNRLTSEIGAQIETLVKQNTLLVEARDSLLPKLMSGAIQV